VRVGGEGKWEEERGGSKKKSKKRGERRGELRPSKDTEVSKNINPATVS